MAPLLLATTLYALVVDSHYYTRFRTHTTTSLLDLSPVHRLPVRVSASPWAPPPISVEHGFPDFPLWATQTQALARSGNPRKTLP